MIRIQLRRNVDTILPNQFIISWRFFLNRILNSLMLASLENLRLILVFREFIVIELYLIIRHEF